MSQRVLFVESDDDIREVVLWDLEERGYEVQGSPNGRAALDALRTSCASAGDLVAIVVDLMLPETDGWTLLREVRRDPSLREVGVVVTTGGEDIDGIPAAAYVLRKPYTLSELGVAVEHVLSRKGGMPAPKKRESTRSE